MCATEPFAVSWTGGPSVACGSNCRIASIDAFFRLTGRGNGTTLPAGNSSSVSSSDSSLQPRLTSPAHKVLLPDPDCPGNRSAAPFFSTAAACTIRYWWQWLVTHQLRPHSSIANPCAAGSGLNGKAWSKWNRTCDSSIVGDRAADRCARENRQNSPVHRLDNPRTVAR